MLIYRSGMTAAWVTLVFCSFVGSAAAQDDLSQRPLPLPERSVTDLPQHMELLKRLRSLVESQKNAPNNSEQKPADQQRLPELPSPNEAPSEANNNNKPAEESSPFQPQQLQQLQDALKNLANQLPPGFVPPDLSSVPPDQLRKAMENPAIQQQMKQMLEQFAKDGVLPKPGEGGSQLPVPPRKNTAPGQQNNSNSDPSDRNSDDSDPPKARASTESRSERPPNTSKLPQDSSEANKPVDNSASDAAEQKSSNTNDASAPNPAPPSSLRSLRSFLKKLAEDTGLKSPDPSSDKSSSNATETPTESDSQAMSPDPKTSPNDGAASPRRPLRRRDNSRPKTSSPNNPSTIPSNDPAQNSTASPREPNSSTPSDPGAYRGEREENSTDPNSANTRPNSLPSENSPTFPDASGLDPSPGFNVDPESAQKQLEELQRTFERMKELADESDSNEPQNGGSPSTGTPPEFPNSNSPSTQTPQSRSDRMNSSPTPDGNSDANREPNSIPSNNIPPNSVRPNNGSVNRMNENPESGTNRNSNEASRSLRSMESDRTNRVPPSTGRSNQGPAPPDTDNFDGEQLPESLPNVDEFLREQLKNFKLPPGPFPGNAQGNNSNSPGTNRREDSSTANRNSSSSNMRPPGQMDPQELQRLIDSVRNRNNNRAGNASSNRPNEPSEKPPIDVQKELAQQGFGNTLKKLVERAKEEAKKPRPAEQKPADNQSLADDSGTDKALIEQLGKDASGKIQKPEMELSDSVAKMLNGLKDDLQEIAKDARFKDPSERSRSNRSMNQRSASEDNSMMDTLRKSASEILAGPSRNSNTPQSAASGGASSSGATLGEFDFTPVIVLAAILGILAISFLGLRHFKFRASNSAEFQFAGPPLKPSDIHNRADVVQAFHEFAMQSAQSVQSWWTHRTVQQVIQQKSPEYQSAVETLADTYEQARYLPDEQELSAEQLESARSALQRCNRG